MNAYQSLVDAWRQGLPLMANSPAFQRIASGQITQPQYAAVLRQIFHNAGYNPQLMLLCASRLRGQDRQCVKSFSRHAISEIGHDELALRDLVALGEDVGDLRAERPLPATFALMGSATHMIEHHDPVGFLGYIFHLEYTPIQMGARYIEALTQAGIPRAAMGFLEEHARVDVAHCKLMESYCKKLVRTPAQLESVLYMREQTAWLYAQMLQQAIASADARISAPQLVLQPA